MAEMVPPGDSSLVCNSSCITLVKSLVVLAHQVATCDRPQGFQKRNAANIARRIKLLSPLFEEIRDSPETPLPPSALISFQNMYHTMTSTKALLDRSRDASTFWSHLQITPLSEEFHALTRSLAAALESLPLGLLELSDEVQEQVELVRMQLQRAQVFVDPVEEALANKIKFLLNKVEEKEEPTLEELQRLFTGLGLKSARDCKREIERLQRVEVEGGDDHENSTLVPTTNLIGFARYGKCVLYGVGEVGESDDEPSPSQSTNFSLLDSGEISARGRESEVLKPSDEFRCPISLDLMLDPVIVATGQTYDRVSITRWIEAGHSTCPKSGQKLGHTNFVPNYALRSLISQWCEDHHIPFEKSDKLKRVGGVDQGVATTKAALEATRMTVSFLVGKLATGSPEVQKQVAYELRLLAKCDMDNRMCIAEAGAIPHLVGLLSSEDPKTQENAVTALLNLSIYDHNKALIVSLGALDPIIEVLRRGKSMEARENGAATLFSLSVVDEYKFLIGSKPFAIPALVALLRDGTPQRGKKDAATALFNLAVYPDNKAHIIAAGIIPVLVSLLVEEEAGIADDALAVLALLAGSREGLTTTGMESAAIPALVRLLRVGTPKGRENAVAILHALCKNGGKSSLAEVVRVNTAVPSLYSLLTMGTSRAKRKSSSLLKLLQKQEFPSTATG